MRTHFTNEVRDVTPTVDALARALWRSRIISHDGSRTWERALSSIKGRYWREAKKVIEHLNDAGVILVALTERKGLSIDDTTS